MEGLAGITLHQWLKEYGLVEQWFSFVSKRAIKSVSFRGFTTRVKTIHHRDHGLLQQTQQNIGFGSIIPWKTCALFRVFAQYTDLTLHISNSRPKCLPVLLELSQNAAICSPVSSSDSFPISFQLWIRAL